MTVDNLVLSAENSCKSFKGGSIQPLPARMKIKERAKKQKVAIFMVKWSWILFCVNWKLFCRLNCFSLWEWLFFLKQPTSIEVEVSTYREKKKNDGFWIVQYRPFFIVGFIALHNFELLNYANKYKHIQLCNLYLDSYVILLLNTKGLYVIQNVEY